MPALPALARLSLLATAALAASALAGCPRPGAKPERSGDAAPQQLRTWLTPQADGSLLRRFEGVAAPENLSFVEAASGASRRVHELFPSDRCPFAIDLGRRLGAGGLALEVVDRTLAGVVPTAADAVWPLNMIPFGVALDGAILDPSGPWYDGGPADPQNAFDRACSGWEYDPIHPGVAALVGVSSEVRGHVQPGPGGIPGSRGLFHYHGTPEVMLGAARSARSAGARDQPFVVGYSADGFWILDGVLPAPSSGGRELHLFSGYLLRQGARSAQPHTDPSLVPAGVHDGTFVQDWIHDPAQKRALIEAALRETGAYHGLALADREAGRADYELLDERNGLVTDRLEAAGAPRRAYAYVLTPDMPQLPRWFAFEPSASFRENIIPLDAPGSPAPPGRRQLYEACAPAQADVHRWSGREPY